MRSQLNSNEIKTKVIDVIFNVFNIDKSKINQKMDLDNTDDWDSLKHMNLIIALEEEFNINFQDSEIIQINSFNKIIEVISKHQN